MVDSARNKINLKSLRKNILSVAVTFLLLLVLFTFYPIANFLNDLAKLSAFQIAVILTGGLFFLLASGIELYFYYRIYSARRISMYDMFTLPLVMNLWGHILPFQGAFIYNALYLKSKYLISVGTNLKVYIFQFACSISIGVMILLWFKINNNTIQPIEYFIYILSILIPFFYNKSWWLIQIFLQKYLPGRFQLDNLSYSEFSIKKIIFLFFINLMITFIYSLWLHVIAEILDYKISFVAILIAAILSKVALLFRFTPGNIGVNQFAFSGIFVLLGLAASQGVSISLYVSAAYFCISFTIGIIFHIINQKYISLNKIFLSQNEK